MKLFVVVFLAVCLSFLSFSFADPLEDAEIDWANVVPVEDLPGFWDGRDPILVPDKYKKGAEQAADLWFGPKSGPKVTKVFNEKKSEIKMARNVYWVFFYFFLVIGFWTKVQWTLQKILTKKNCEKFYKNASEVPKIFSFFYEKNSKQIFKNFSKFSWKFFFFTKIPKIFKN